MQFLYMILILLITPFLSEHMAQNISLLTPKDILLLKYKPADHRLMYGEHKLQFGYLRLPEKAGPHPIVVVIHGGCWMSKFANIDFMSPFAEALTKSGVATWNIEYRTIDQEGGWPNTFLDVGKAIDHLKQLSLQYNLDLNNVVVVGHSAGGHLALWAAGRHKLPNTSEVYVGDPMPVSAVINLAGPGDLRSFLSLEKTACGCKVISSLLASDKHTEKERYAEASPYELLPLNIRQVLIAGEFDKAAPIEMMLNYLDAALKLGDAINLISIKGCGHFDLIAPGSKAFDIVQAQILEIMQLQK
jgi:acetyl esterase/lipase